MYWPITIKFGIRKQTSNHKLITVAVCSLVISRLIGLFLATQEHSINISSVHGFVSFTVIQRINKYSKDDKANGVQAI